MTDDTEWHAWRRAGITASDIARATSGKYGGMYGVVADKLGLTAPQEYTDRMARGHALEATAQTAAELLTGLHIVGEQYLAEHAEHPEWRATLDGLASPIPEPTLDDCTHVVEVKSRGVEVRSAWDYWHPQTQWQMLVTGIPRALLVEIIVTDADPVEVHAVKVHRLEADPLTQAMLTDTADRIVEHVNTCILPEPATASELDSVKDVHRVADGTTVDLTPMADIIARFLEIKTAVAAVETERDALEAQIRAAVGPATTATAGPYLVKVSEPRRKITPEGEQRLLAAHPDCVRADLAAIRKKDPDLYKATGEPVGARTLTVKENQ